MARRFGQFLLQGVSGCLLTGFLWASAALAGEERVGERLFLVRDKPGTPTQFQVIVNAGCVDEAGGQCRGLAHYLEHLVLVGRNSDHRDIAMRLLFPDGSSNGWTSARGTGFVHSMPAREDGPRADLETLFGFYAARLKDFSISEADAERERNVVRQEHDYRVSSRPFVRFARKLDRLLVPDHPAGQWPIGLPEDIAALTLEDARAFHRNWYVLNNVYFVVKADLDPASLKEIAERALAGMMPRPLPARPAAQPPSIVAERTDIREHDAAIKRPGVYFKKLVHIEEGNNSLTGPARGRVTSFLQSRLPGSMYDALVEQDKLAAGAVAISMSRIAPKAVVLSIGADVAPDVAPEALLAGISDYVEKLGVSGISADAIERLKKRSLEASAIADKDPRRVYSRLVAWLAARNRYEELARSPERIAAVSPDHVAAVVKGLAGPGRIVTGTLTPAEGRP